MDAHRSDIVKLETNKLGDHKFRMFHHNVKDIKRIVDGFKCFTADLKFHIPSNLLEFLEYFRSYSIIQQYNMRDY
jgi:hypothetical protein